VIDLLTSRIRDVPDFPKPGIVFKDITPLLADPAALAGAVDALAERVAPFKPDIVLGAESRGFILGPALAIRLGVGFAIARKPGKLPWKTVTASYALEYGEDSLELHEDAIVRDGSASQHTSQSGWPGASSGAAASQRGQRGASIGVVCTDPHTQGSRQPIWGVSWRDVRPLASRVPHALPRARPLR
jgi:hypothetical protein